ncbi:MAG: hypothetical protein P4L36_15950 [Holophaga sp.]|nr:hypothetical protein [Holophaga sp.]
MRTLVFPLATLRRACLPAALALLGALGCVKNSSGGTNLYVYDNTSRSVLVWNDVNKVYSAAKAGTTVPSADRTIVNGLSSGEDLSWGGLAMDNTGNRIYLVETDGTVYVINKANTQSGTVSKTADIISFTLGKSGVDPYTAGSVFGQAAVDGNSNILYVLENAANGSATRVWKITNASQVGNSSTITPASSYTIGVSTDTFGCGVAAIPGGNAYGLFGGGTTIYDGMGNNPRSGPRLRQGSGGTFPSPASNDYSSGVVIGLATELVSPLQYGSLAYDSQNSSLYVFAPNYSSPGNAAVLVFKSSAFSPGLDVAPTRSLGDTAGALGNLRAISHPASGDWLLGANFSLTSSSAIGEGTGTSSLLIWDTPSGGSAAVSATLPGVSEIRGMAIGGNN